MINLRNPLAQDSLMIKLISYLTHIVIIYLDFTPIHLYLCPIHIDNRYCYVRIDHIYLCLYSIYLRKPTANSTSFTYF